MFGCPIISLTGFRYFVNFVHDFYRVTRLYFIKSRSKLFSHFTTFCAKIKTQFHVPIQILRSYNVKEYLSKPFQSFMLQHETLHQTSCVDIHLLCGYTASHNGVVERKNSHLLETTQTL